MCRYPDRRPPFSFRFAVPSFPHLDCTEVWQKNAFLIGLQSEISHCLVYDVVRESLLSLDFEFFHLVHIFRAFNVFENFARFWRPKAHIHGIRTDLKVSRRVYISLFYYSVKYDGNLTTRSLVVWVGLCNGRVCYAIENLEKPWMACH